MIPPGGEGEIKVTLKPKGGHTTIEKDVVVFTNDPAQPQLKLTMKGTLRFDVEAVPASVQMTNLAPGEAGVATVSIERSDTSTATVKSARVEDTERFTLREIEAAPGALATYEVRFAGGKVGNVSTKLVVETTGVHTPTLNIPVRASAVTNLVYPERVVLMRNASGTFEKKLRISTRRGDPPKIGKVEDPDGLLDTEVLEAKGPSVEIVLRVREAEATKLDERARHKLWVHTNDRDEPKVEIEYSVRAATKGRVD